VKRSALEIKEDEEAGLQAEHKLKGSGQIRSPKPERYRVTVVLLENYICSRRLIFEKYSYG
jgi:hypothetical protein